MRSKKSGFLLSAALIFAVVFGVAFNVSAAQTGEWLTTSGNHIYKPDGSVWVGRGANLQDTRSCSSGYDFDAFSNFLAPKYDNATGVNEVKRRIDVLVDQWKATFIRLVLESNRAQDSYSADANYRARIKEIVDYIGTKPGVYVLVSIWDDTSLDTKTGWPTDGTNAILAQLAQDFYTYPYVLFGVSNEPFNNADGAQDAQVWERMNLAVAAIRNAESSLGSNRHIVTVQGTREYAQNLSYYVSHRITAGGGVNIAYEIHTYNPPEKFDTLFVSPFHSIPVIIGEFGPNNDTTIAPIVTLDDVQSLMDLAKANEIPYLAFSFHQKCDPNLIGEKPDMTYYANSTSTDGIGMTIYPTDFGKLLIKDLASGSGTTTAYSYTLSPASKTFTSVGGTGSVTVTASSSSCTWTATSSSGWATIITGSGTGSGTASFSVSANKGVDRTGNLTIAGQTFTVTQTGENNCAASVSSSLVLHTPIVTYGGANYWADLQYNSADSTLSVANAGIVSDLSPYGNCTASTLSSDFKLHISVVILDGLSYRADLQYGNSVFVITGGGQN